MCELAIQWLPAPGPLTTKTRLTCIVAIRPGQCLCLHLVLARLVAAAASSCRACACSFARGTLNGLVPAPLLRLHVQQVGMRLGRSIHDAFACNSRDPCFDHAAARQLTQYILLTARYVQGRISSRGTRDDSCAWTMVGYTTTCLVLPERFYLGEACNLSVNCQPGMVGWLVTAVPRPVVQPHRDLMHHQTLWPRGFHYNHSIECMIPRQIACGATHKPRVR